MVPSRSTIPVMIMASGAKAIAGGTNYTLFTRDGGAIWGMGSNMQGQLGDGSNTTRSTPAHVIGLPAHYNAAAKPKCCGWR